MCTKFSTYSTTIDQDISQSLVVYFIVDTVYMYGYICMDVYLYLYINMCRDVCVYLFT